MLILVKALSCLRKQLLKIVKTIVKVLMNLIKISLNVDYTTLSEITGSTPAVSNNTYVGGFLYVVTGTIAFPNGNFMVYFYGLFSWEESYHTPYTDRVHK